MSKASVRRFEVPPGEYVTFRFTVRRSGSLYIRMLATSPVNLLVMDSGNYADYKSGNESYSLDRWNKRIDIEKDIDVWPGTWYLAIEGRDKESSGWLEVFH